MDIDRRQVLIGAVGVALAGSLGGAVAGPSPLPPDVPGAGRWHRLTHSLLERARRTNLPRMAPDRTVVERIIRQLTSGSGYAKPLVIKWMDTPTDAFDRLSRFGLHALLDMGATRFWRPFQASVSNDVEIFDRAFEARMVAKELLGVDVHDRILMAPKLRTKARAISANASDEEIFRVRAVSSQIGWLETSMADVAVQAVSNAELLLSTGASERSVAIEHQLKVFASYERGLMATWETPAELVCVQRIKVKERPFRQPLLGRYRGESGRRADNRFRRRLTPTGHRRQPKISHRTVSNVVHPEPVAALIGRRSRSAGGERLKRASRRWHLLGAVAALPKLPKP